jgi:aspartate aminotransferase
MNFLSTRVQTIKPSPIFSIIQKTRELTAKGHDIINLAGGEPDFPTPKAAQDAAIHAMQTGQTLYTAVDGIPELKKAIQEKFKHENNLDFSLDEIMVSTGAKQVLYNAFMATLNPGDQVIIPAPYWVSYPEMVALAEGEPVFVACTLENDLKLTPEMLEKAITPKTKWLLLNSPNNPTGAVYTQKELILLADVLMRHPHVYVMSDDIYEHILFDHRTFHTMASVALKLADRVLTINGVSKTYAMTGWRIGYAGGPKHLIQAMKTIQSQSTSCASSIAQAAAWGALTQPQDFLQEWSDDYQERRDFVVNQLNQIPGLHCPSPEGAFYVLASCVGVLNKRTPDGNVLKDDHDFVTYLLESAGVAVTPGIVFGAKGYFRLAFPVSREILDKACKNIAHAVKNLQS